MQHTHSATLSLPKHGLSITFKCIDKRKIDLKNNKTTLDRMLVGPETRLNKVMIEGPGLAKDYETILNTFQSVHQATSLILEGRKPPVVPTGTTSPFASWYGRDDSPGGYRDLSLVVPNSGDQESGALDEESGLVIKLHSSVFRTQSNVGDVIHQAPLVHGTALEVDPKLEPGGFAYGREAAEIFVRALYTNQVPNDMNNKIAQQVYRLAHFYDISSIKEMTKVKAQTQDLIDTQPISLVAPKQFVEGLRTRTFPDAIGALYLKGLEAIKIYSDAISNHVDEAILHGASK